MASSSGTSSATSSPVTSPVSNNSTGSDSDLQALMDERKRKRMVSNRESARRSRMRKQKHLDDLTAQVDQLRKENGQIVASISVTTQHFLSLDADNSVLRAQVGELSHRLDSLNEILQFLTPAADAIGGGVGGGVGGGGGFGYEYDMAGMMAEHHGGCFWSPMNSGVMNQAMSMGSAAAAAADVFLVN
ncbi:bZIP transcription factor 44 [Linum grandiflorum]